MDATFTHLNGDIRQPVLVIGDDPDAEGNVLYAPFAPTQSTAKTNLYDSAVASPTDTVEGAAPAATDAAATAATDEDVVVDNAAEQYADNGDGTYTRQSDGVRGHFTPDGFVASGGEEVSGVSWGAGN